MSTDKPRRAKCPYCGRSYQVTPRGRIPRHRIRQQGVPVRKRPVCGGGDRLA